MRLYRIYCRFQKKRTVSSRKTFRSDANKHRLQLEKEKKVSDKTKELKRLYRYVNLICLIGNTYVHLCA